MQPLIPNIDPLLNFRKMLEKDISGITQSVEILKQSIIAPMQESIRFMQQSMTLVLPDMKKMFQWVEEFKKYSELEKAVLIESGWFICPSLNNIPHTWIAKAVHLYNRGNKNSITNLMKTYYGQNDWEELTRTVEQWSKNRYFTNQRIKIIKDALSAHKLKMYTLSIPALLPVMEGISGDYCKRQKITVDASKSLLKAQKAMEELKDNNELYLAEVALGFIENQLYVKTDSLRHVKNRKFLNRHGILHGTYSGYADCARSLKCFLLLDILTLLG